MSAATKITTVLAAAGLPMCREVHLSRTNRIQPAR